MKHLLVLLLLSGFISGTVSCSNNDDEEPLVACPSPSYLSGVITQVQAIQKEAQLMETQLANAQGTDREALVSNINKAKEREKVLLDELSIYRHCL